ncbi:MAG: hypothetical protein IJY33_02015 [Oscillospiraceae bacterium]|nr:hypothetical protein [Oscillospiraceae bacterium]MBQ8869733.1 hypothetical protein [Oscillospiraceae bacterium]
MADMNLKDAKPFLEYKGRPLVRCGKTLYYGNLYDDYVVMMQIVDTVPFGDMNFAGKIIVQLLNTDPNAAPTELVIKKTDTRGLFNAIDIAAVWLDTALEDN